MFLHNKKVEQLFAIVKLYHFQLLRKVKDKIIFKYLIEQEDKVDSEGDKKRQHSHVVKVSGKVVLQKRRERRRHRFLERLSVVRLANSVKAELSSYSHVTKVFFTEGISAAVSEFFLLFLLPNHHLIIQGSC